LHRAIESGHFDVVQCLVNHQSVVDRRAIAAATATNNYRILNYLSVHEYCTKGHIEYIIKLVTCYPKLVNAIDEVLLLIQTHHTHDYRCIWFDGVQLIPLVSSTYYRRGALHCTEHVSMDG